MITAEALTARCVVSRRTDVVVYAMQGPECGNPDQDKVAARDLRALCMDLKVRTHGRAQRGALLLTAFYLRPPLDVTDKSRNDAESKRWA